MLALCLVLTILPLTGRPAQATDYDLEVFVNQASGDDSNTGADAAHAYKSVTQAMRFVEGESAENPVIHIAKGTYTENLTFTKSVSLIGEDASTTIINGSAGSVIAVTGTDNAAVVENLTVSNGQARTGDDGHSGGVDTPYIATDGEAGGSGGGLYCDGDLAVKGHHY